LLSSRNFDAKKEHEAHDLESKVEDQPLGPNVGEAHTLLEKHRDSIVKAERGRRSMGQQLLEDFTAQVNLATEGETELKVLEETMRELVDNDFWDEVCCRRKFVIICMIDTFCS
jgi:hypothetical protein